MRLNRRLWLLVHGWLSLPIWLLFCFICLTGTLAVMSHEITWLANPEARALNPGDAPAKPIPELVEAVRREVPDAEIARVMTLEPYLITAIKFSSPDSPHNLAYVNQYTGAVQELGSGITFIEFMRSLHGWLLFPWQNSYSIGYYLVGAMSLVVLGALITGPVIYKRFWRALTQPRVRTDRGSRAFLGDLHRLGGVWSLWFLLVMGLTGLWYLTQGILWHNGISAWERPEPVALADVPKTDHQPPEHISVARALAAARQAHPGIEPTWVAFPEHNRGHFDVAGSGPGFLYDDFAYRAFISPWTGTVAQSRQPAGMGPMQTIAHIADPLHYGTLGGLWTKIVWFVFGLLLTGMSITGFLIWTRRTAVATRDVSKDRTRRGSEAGPTASMDLEDART
ncbi:PepSY-associated TM helix domain-containing protein [Thiohalorhabdus sp. Cl-TMA]|uniref:PepSY-associated TM helix domain-containing protein n=1 Tax=Thiohalorhabdus methylotrophus TaxID=3242694 RepID=A0ABV4U052_9GAMM